MALETHDISRGYRKEYLATSFILTDLADVLYRKFQIRFPREAGFHRDSGANL